MSVTRIRSTRNDWDSFLVFFAVMRNERSSTKKWEKWEDDEQVYSFVASFFAYKCISFSSSCVLLHLIVNFVACFLHADSFAIFFIGGKILTYMIMYVIKNDEILMMKKYRTWRLSFVDRENEEIGQDFFALFTEHNFFFRSFTR